MHNIVFLSQDSMEGYVCDDDLALDAFAKRGLNVHTISWRAAQDWSRYDAVVVRSTWDYQRDSDRFFTALTSIDQATRLANPLALMHWNMDKKYLAALEDAGVPIVPTLFGKGLTSDELDTLLDSSGAECVIKPVISAGAERTFRVPPGPSEALRAEILSAHGDREWMWQPFLSRIIDEGEYSVFFFNGVFSHAIVKKPKSGDFRVQEEFGGHISAVEPGPDMLRAAVRVMQALTETPLYARVDLVRGDAGWMLIEVELIEPSLYLRTRAVAVDNFADAVSSWMSG